MTAAGSYSKALRRTSSPPDRRSPASTWRPTSAAECPRSGGLRIPNQAPHRNRGARDDALDHDAISAPLVPRDVSGRERFEIDTLPGRVGRSVAGTDEAVAHTRCLDGRLDAEELQAPVRPFDRSLMLRLEELDHRPHPLGGFG